MHRIASTACLLIVLGCVRSAVAVEQTVIDLPQVRDDARRRAVPITIHLPARAEPQPLVLVSHGGGASRHAMYALSAELARQGYVVLCIEHVGSNTDEIRRRMRAKNLDFRAAALDSGDDMTERKNRPLDVRFAIDLATKLNAEDERFKGRIDTAHIAMLGHSYGAYTTMVSCGARPVKIDADLTEPRIQVGIALSPLSASGKFFDKESFANVSVPFIGISGTQDIAGDGHRDFFKLMPKGDKHLLWFHDASHVSFSDPTGGRVAFRIRIPRSPTR